MLDRSGPLVRRGRYRAVFQSGAGVVKLVLISALILTVSLVLCSCAAGKKLSRDGYEWVPVEKATSQPASEHNKMLALVGKPDAVWKTTFGTHMWVYCQYGAPVRILVFGEHEMIKEGSPSTDRTDLCEEP